GSSAGLVQRRRAGRNDLWTGFVAMLHQRALSIPLDLLVALVGLAPVFPHATIFHLPSSADPSRAPLRLCDDLLALSSCAVRNDHQMAYRRPSGGGGCYFAQPRLSQRSSATESRRSPAPHVFRCMPAHEHVGLRHGSPLI